MPGWKQRFKPAVSKKVLLGLAGAMWLGVGTMLLSLAAGWLRAWPGHGAVWLAGGGFVVALLIHHLGLLRVVDKNLARILPMQGKRCVFSFMPLRSYGLIAVMIGLGVTLRHSPIPKHILAVFYVAMGAALVLSSVRYLRVLLTQPVD